MHLRTVGQAVTKQLTISQRPGTPSKRLPDFLVVLMLACAVTWAETVAAWQSESHPTLEQVTVGWGGQVKTGFWNPLRIQIRGGSQKFKGRLAVSATDGDGLPVQFVWEESDAVVVDPNAQITLERFVKFGRPARFATAELIDASGESRVASAHVELEPILRSDRELFLSIGTTIGIEDALARWSATSQRPTSLYRVKEAAELPESWIGYDPVDTVVLTTADAQALEGISEGQWSALREWVQLGGRMIVCVGARGAEVLAEKSPLTSFVQGEFDQVATLRNASPLETYSGDPSRKALPSRIPITVLKNVRGRVELFDLTPSGERPMIVRSPLGLGRVVFVAFDLDQSPFREWEGRARLVERVMRESSGRTDTPEKFGAPTQAVQYGYNDMSGQLRSAMDQFPGVRLVAFSWVAGLLLVYVLLIGPADYFLLHDIFKRMQWTWLTFPILAAVFVAIAVGMNRRFRGDDVRVNHVDLVDVDQSTRTVRGTSWMHLYSPTSSLYEVEIRSVGSHVPGFIPRGSILSWHGLPGTSLGGMDLDAVSSPAGRPYKLQFDDRGSRLIDVPLAIASTKSFVTRWWGTAELNDLASLQVDSDGLLRGEMVNPLSLELSDCTVYFENWVYRLDSQRGVLAPGQRTRIENERALNLQWRLSGRRVIDSKDITTPWDQNTLDVSKILEMMMLHGAAGGEAYTQLANRYQKSLDLSDHLQSGRAVLLGRAKVAANQVVLNGNTQQGPHVQHWTYCRVVFPVEKQRD